MGDIFSLVVVMATFFTCLGVGVVAWTLTEYSAHRFAMHSVGGRGPAAKEHLMHHAEPERTRAFIRTLGHLGMYSTAAGIGIVGWWVLDRFTSLPAWVAFGFALGWALGYTLYEGLHWFAHHRPPRGEFDLRLRRRHFHHHFAEPKKNLGVMFAGWDVLLGTNVEPSQVKVPRRLAMPWLVDDNGDVRPEFADDYVLCGRLTRSEIQDAADRVRAFADQAPTLD